MSAMAQKDRENEVEERSSEKSSEKHHRVKSEKDPNRPHKSKSSRSKMIDPETGEVIKSSRSKTIDPETGEVVKSSHRRRRDKDKEKGNRSSEPASSIADLVPELSRTASAPGASSRSSLPYPSFNKTYSKEAVSREDVSLPARTKSNPYTPESTDVGSDAKSKSKSTDNFARSTTAHKNSRPPSPPDTEFTQHRKATLSRVSQLQEEEEVESRSSSRNSWFGKTTKERDDRSKVSDKSKGSRASTIRRTKSEKDAHKGVLRDSGIGSGPSTVTSVTAKRESPKPVSIRPPALDSDSSPDSVQDSSPRTPTQTPQFPPPDLKPTPSSFVQFQASEAESTTYDSPQPPPPPPPPNVPLNIPRVDYLMQNGGLLRPVPKTLLPSQQSSLGASTSLPLEIEKIFGPYYSILDQYEAVINRNGSLAVATGYRSVARRLLDRLENVFNRDLSSEGCSCVMCQDPDLTTHEGSRGLGWGEVLEWTSGRRDLPMWPAFDFATLGVKAGEELAGLGISGDPARPGSPVKIDPDIAEEYHNHFLQQTKKTKLAVNRWLSSCPQTAATPPQEVDDETLSFAILTHLDQNDRPIFNALISGSTVLQPGLRAPTPFRKPPTEFMAKTVQSLQRLYRLPNIPRIPEAAIYLLRNPQLHNLLATMGSINTSEWEILTSGRFDGFLWSGADSESVNPSPAPSRGPTPANGRGVMSPHMRQASNSRTTTPFSPMRSQTFSPSMGYPGFPPSRGPTPSQVRQPVSNDEETEIAVLAEVEREIYQGMELLEDAFEGLHRKAEFVRRALRERGAGLSVSLQSRRTCYPDIISSGTPSLPSGGLGPGYERPHWGESSEMMSESDWDPGEEMMSELAPDDSASNISSSRHRRPKRRTERRTPAPVEEEDEEE